MRHLSLARRALVFSLLVVVGSPVVPAQTLYVPNGAGGIGSPPTGNGNVGIGTSGPAMKLDVNSSLGTTDGIRFTGSSAAWLWIQTTAGSGYSAGVEVVGGANGADWLMLTNRGDLSTNADDLLFYKNAAGTGSQGAKLTIQSGGNVGIGTTAPDKLLTLYGSDSSNQIGGSLTGIHIVNSNAAAGGRVTEITFGGRAESKKPFAAVSAILVSDSLYEQAGDLAFSTKDVTTATYPTERMRILGSGNVGIGTTAPTEKLTVYGQPNSTPGVMSLESSREDAQNVEVGRISAKNGTVEIGRLSVFRADGSYTGYMAFFTKASNGAALTETMRLDKAGNVGIGTAVPTHKLSVNGAIRAKEVIVDTGWADYVFADDYRLAPLSEVESQIKTEKHLPGIPAATEIAEHGVSIGEMQKLLLQKIEELTLHLIAVEKRTQVLEAENARLKAGK